MINFKITLQPHHLIYFLVVLVVTMGLFIGFNYLRRQTTKKLQDLLYKEENFFLYEELLKNKRLKLIFKKGRIELFRLNGYLAQGKNKEIKESIAKLNILKLNRYERLDFIMKKFSFFVSIQDKKASKEALEALRAHLKNSKTKILKDQLAEAELVYAIYLKKDTNLISVLLEKAKTQTNPYMKGVTYFRVAKLFYFAGDKAKTNKYLSEAKPLLKATYYYPVIEEALKNHKILETK